jgi:hypothetical protein
MYLSSDFKRTICLYFFGNIHVFLKCMCFRNCVFLMFFMKSRRDKRGQREIQGAQHSGNPIET